MKTLGADRSSSLRHLHRSLRCAGALALASWIGSTSMAADAPAMAGLTMHFIGLKFSQGAVMVAVYNSEAAYENSGTASDTATRTLKLEIKDGTAVTTLEGLPPGEYAIKAFHDLNGDAKLNTNLFGIPTEPVAFSNDAPVHMHAPSWKETVFVVRAGDNAISIHID
jgi:uncharacterized protein (DUF2141 family)